MRAVVVKETYPGELRVAITPSGIKKLTGIGLQVAVQAGLGQNAGFPDSKYIESGAEVIADTTKLFTAADLVVRIRKPQLDDLDLYPTNLIHISFLDPYNEKQLIEKFAGRDISAISLEMIPRSTLAQKMDALSSQASLGGYVAVVQAAAILPKIFPMMMTPAGTIAAARVFVIGAGVAGLQAIATAKRMGARVTAFDTRPVVAEQVQSLGARFVKIDIGATGQTANGYAKALTEEQLDIQRREMTKVIADSDVVITTAQLFGRPAPRIVSQDMVAAMRPGSVIVDMAVASGGNVEGSKLNTTVDVNGVRIIGQGNLPAFVAENSSEMLSANICNLIIELNSQETGTVDFDNCSAIIRGCLVTHRGKSLMEER